MATMTKAGADGYGPKKSNPHYVLTLDDGTRLEVRRHKWCLPAVQWGWVARPLCADGRPNASVVPVYADTLADLRLDLGIQGDRP